MSVLHLRARALRLACCATALSTGVVLATTAGPAAAADGEASRVLQSVGVEMAPDGTLTQVDGTVVQSEGDPDDAESSESTYNPADVAGKLPVRVMTAWRTADGAGSDLSELEGYDGRVQIDLTVQNLTVRPQTLTYDVDGQSREQAALVGAPLTVVAAADLGDLKPASVVTDDATSTRDVTNGVISKGEEGRTQVQWATILAPPQLGAAATFSLVVDAEDFAAPEIDLSIQPGLVTDPSMGGLVDSAFNPASSDELELQARTIDLIGDVNAVLARAGSTIADVRSTLSSSAETLGTQTIADLQASTQTVASSMGGLGSTLEALQGDLSSSMKETGSSAVAELDQAVTTVDQMLGDTSAQPPAARVDANGCRTSVSRPRDAQTVFGNLLQVASQLDGYAKATDYCKTALRDSIVSTIGPDEPTAELCVDNTSVTCSLFGAETTFKGIAEDLRDLSDKAIDLLDPNLYKAAIDASTLLNAEVQKVKDIVDDLNTGRVFVSNVLRNAEGVLRDGEEFDQELDKVAASLATIHEDAESVLTALEGTPDQVAEAAAAFCDFEKKLADDALTEPQRQAFNDAVSHLQRVGCDGEELTLPQRHPVPLSERFADDPLDKVRSIAASSDPEGAQQGAGAALAALEDIRVEMRDDVIEALNYRRGRDPEGPTLAQLQLQLNEALAELEKQRKVLDDAVGDLEDVAAEVPDIEEQINDAVDKAQGEIDASIAADTRRVGNARDGATSQLGEMFTQSSEGMRTAARDVVRNGRQTLDQQKTEFSRAQAEAGNRISGEIEQGLALVAGGVDASTRDIEAAGTLLTADLRKVLLDLGERRVNGGGLLGAMTTGAATAGAADYQLALATRSTTAYANVRGRDIAGILLRQAQTDAAMQMLAEMPAFEMDLPSGTTHRTVYSFSIGGDE